MPGFPQFVVGEDRGVFKPPQGINFETHWKLKHRANRLSFEDVWRFMQSMKDDTVLMMRSW